MPEIAAPHTSTSDADALLTFVVGPYLFCTSGLAVEGIIRPPAIAALPNNHPCYRGVFFRQERTALVIDLRCLFGLTRRTHLDSGELILTTIRGELAAFWVDDVLDVLETGQTDWRDTPPALANGVFDRFGRLDNDLYIYVRFENLLDADPRTLADALRALAPNAREEAPAPVVVATGTSEAKTAVASETRTETAVTEAAATPSTTAPEPARRPSPVAANNAFGTTAPRSANLSRTARRPSVAAATTGVRATQAAQRAGGAYVSSPATPPPGHSFERTAGHHATDTVRPATGAETQQRENSSSAPWILLVVAILVLLALLGWWLAPRGKPATPAPGHKPDSPAASTRVLAPVAPSPADTAAVSSTTPTDTTAKQIVHVDTPEITVTVERPAAPTAAAAPSPAAPVVAKVADKPTTTQLPGGSTEVVHIVKRGDTLWAITQKHLGNPFRYPELARLSNIRNPDLIYPGDRVRIVIKKPAARQ